MKYGDMPTTTGTPYPQPQMRCHNCGATFSAERGDYWMVSDSTIVTCGNCGGLSLELGREKTVWEPERFWDENLARP